MIRPAGTIEAELAECRKRIEALEEELARHPLVRDAYFLPALEQLGDQAPRLHPLVNGVTSIRPIEGLTDSRKNMMKWRGFRYEMAGVHYEVRWGSNWCSDLAELEDLDVIPCRVRPLDVGLLDQAGDAAIVTSILVQDPPMAIALLLRFTEAL